MNWWKVLCLMASMLLEWQPGRLWIKHCVPGCVVTQTSCQQWSVLGWASLRIMPTSDISECWQPSRLSLRGTGSHLLSRPPDFSPHAWLTEAMTVTVNTGSSITGEIQWHGSLWSSSRNSHLVVTYSLLRRQSVYAALPELSLIINSKKAGSLPGLTSN